MTEHTKLVEALRCGNDGKLPCDNKECPYWVDQWHGIGLCNILKKQSDAAAAIEALQEYLSASNDEVNHLAESNKELQAELNEQLPKRGKWIEDTTTYAGPGLSNYKCSLCGKICGTWRRGLKQDELPNFCGNCGADMRAKMEVQDGQ